MKRKPELLNNLAQLQNLIKRDAASYQSEFDTQFRHFESIFELFKLKPTEENVELQELIMFLGQVSVFVYKGFELLQGRNHEFSW
jgi:protein SDA1